MTTTRRKFLKSGIAATAASTLPAPAVLAQAAEEIKLHSFVPPTHVIWTDVITPWAADVAKRSNNRLTIRLFPAMQLGGKPPELYRQTLQGITDATFTLPGYTSNDFPMMMLTELPGAANSAEDGTKKLWANFDKYLARDFKGAKVLSLWNSDSASLMAKSKGLSNMEDIKGMKIRTPSAAQTAQLETLGATPIDMPAPAIYNNLDRGVIDATMIPMSAALDFKLIEVARHYTIDAPLGRSPFLVAMNEARYNKLPAELKKVIDDTTGLSLSLKCAQTYDKKNSQAIEEVKKRKYNLISLAPKESQRWVAAFKPMIQRQVEEWEKKGLPAKALVGTYGLLA
jgi:TRAP-type C4-dicarboxylate transport system substrate-binding protein